MPDFECARCHGFVSVNRLTQRYLVRKKEFVCLDCAEAIDNGAPRELREPTRSELFAAGWNIERDQDGEPVAMHWRNLS